MYQNYKYLHILPNLWEWCKTISVKNKLITSVFTWTTDHFLLPAYLELEFRADWLTYSPSSYFWCTDYAFHLLTLCQNKNALMCGTEERQTPHPFIWFSVGAEEQEYFWDMACWCCKSVLVFQQHVMSRQQLLGPRVTQRFCPSQSFVWLKKVSFPSGGPKKFAFFVLFLTFI